MATKTKAPADYDRLADETEVRMDGFAARVANAMAGLDTLLKDHPKRAEVRKLVEFYARAAFDLHNEKAKLARYQELRDGKITS